MPLFRHIPPPTTNHLPQVILRHVRYRPIPNPLENVRRCRARHIGVEPAECIALLKLLVGERLDARRSVPLPSQVPRGIHEIDPDTAWCLAGPCGHGDRPLVFPYV